MRMWIRRPFIDETCKQAARAAGVRERNPPYIDGVCRVPSRSTARLQPRTGALCSRRATGHMPADSLQSPIGIRSTLAMGRSLGLRSMYTHVYMEDNGTLVHWRQGHDGHTSSTQAHG